MRDHLVSFRWQRRMRGCPTRALRELARRTMARLDLGAAEVGVLLCDDATIRSLNRRFRGKDAPTDVLSFPGGPGPGAGVPYLGDIAISLETAARQAAAAGLAPDAEVKTLLLHGLLHLAGYDHETDRGRMRRLETRLRRELLP